MVSEHVFGALADKTRRSLLDRLFERDGQTLWELCEGIALSRFAVMKHLRVLHAAKLVVTHKVGRNKHHYLNPVPVRLVHDRWTSKYAAPFTATLGSLKQTLENPVEKPMHVYEIYIRTTPEALWQAITDPEMSKQYFYGAAVQSSWEVGAAITHKDPHDECMLEGQVLEVLAPQRLVHSFLAAHDPEMKKEPATKVTWTIEPQGDVCKLTLVHEGFETKNKTYGSVGPGWNVVLSGLKTLLETGKPLMQAAG